MDPKQFQIKDFQYDLPDASIAKYPLTERDSGKLLIYRPGTIEQDIFRNIDRYIPENALLIFNNTRVIRARLHFWNESGAKIEIFCLEPNEVNARPSEALLQKESIEWECLVGRAHKWKAKTLTHKTKNLLLIAEILKKSGSLFTIKFSWEPGHLSFAEILEQAGEMPIPPYLKRESEEIDVSRYQTVFAQQGGSVAAPTAGLHFTKPIFENLKSKNALVEYVTLHVGAGTFKPVTSETLEGHTMHAEWIEVERKSIERILEYVSNEESPNTVVTVGTTSLRTTESLYWMGVKANLNVHSSIQELEIKQWEAYKLPQSLSTTQALSSLLTWMQKNKTEKLICKTQIMIAPPYHLRIANALITNFHQPGSTLLLLVAAVVGDDWKMIYNHALKNDFRFLSYGDGSLLFTKNQ